MAKKGWILLALILACGTARAVEVKLAVEDAARVPRQPGVVTSGVPFAKGAVKDAGRLSVSVGDKPIPAQFIPIALWDDGSVRWALMDCQVDLPAGGKAEVVVCDDGKNIAPPSPVKVEQKADAVSLSTGPLELTISKSKFNLFQAVKVNGKDLVDSSGRGLVVLKDDGTAVVAGPPTEVTVEQAGPMRAIICLRGKFPDVHNDMLGYTVRVTGLAGQKAVKVHVWLQNHGSTGYRSGDDDGRAQNVEWFAFDGMAVELGLGLGEPITARCEEAEAAGSFKVLQVCKQVRDPAEVKTRARGLFYTWKDFEYTIAAQGKELKKGERTDGVIELVGAGARLTAAVRDFWQNYEKSIELDGKMLRLWLWPVEGQWPRSRGKGGLRFPFDKNLENIARENLYLLQGSVQKGHEFILDFSGRDPRATHAELSAPLFALASAEYYATTEAAVGLFAPPTVRTGDKDCDAKLDSWARMSRSATDPASPNSLLKAREDSTVFDVGYFMDSSLWFGWMDFGDLCIPGRGMVSIHHDWPWIVLVNLLQTGDPNCLRLAGEMVRHRVDIDQAWSDRDPADCRGLQRGEYNWPSLHCYRLYVKPNVRTNWLAGLVLYYMLTGEPMALECCRRNSQALKAAWQHVANAQAYGGPQGDMLANGFSMASFGAMYDLTGDKKWLGEAMNLFDTNVTPKWKSNGPHLHDGSHQIVSQDYVQEDMKYCYAIQFLCELHHRTGDEKVLKLLTEGCKKEFPESFFDAPMFLSGLFAYTGYRTANKEYVARAAELFAESFPESKCPPVFLPNNSVWSRQSAMMLRSAHLLQYGTWKSKAAK